MLDHQGAALEIDIRHAQPHGLTEPHPRAVQHQDQGTQHRAADVPALVGSGGGQQAAHLVVRKDVGEKDRFLDRCQRVLGHVACRITAPPMQAELADDPELVAHRDRLASGDPGNPAGYRLVECYFAVDAPAGRDKAHEAVEDELGAPVAYPHGVFEAQELLRIPGQFGGRHAGGHFGTGSETSRRDCVATRAYAETDSGSRCPSSSASSRGFVPTSSWRAAYEWRRT